MTSLSRIAHRFAYNKHGEINQVRKYTGDPYIVHPAAVVKLVESVPHTEEMLAAAWLHDTVEDTDTTIEEIQSEFGEEVAELVEMLTDVSKPEDGNRKIRKAMDRHHLSEASPKAKTIKLADLIDNSRSIIKYDPGFAKVFISEMELLLPRLHQGNSRMWLLANKVIKDYRGTNK